MCLYSFSFYDYPLSFILFFCLVFNISLQVIQNNLLEAAKSVANSAAKLVSSAKQQRADVSNPAAQQKLSAASTDVIGTIDQIVMAAGDLPGGERCDHIFLLLWFWEESVGGGGYELTLCM